MNTKPALLLLGTIALARPAAVFAQEQSVIDQGETIVVTGQRYLDDKPTSATKTDTPAVETPQSIITVTRRQMDHQNAQTVGAALRYSAGVLSDVDATSRYDSVFLRGFGSFGTTSNFVSFLDGLKLPRGQAFAQTSIDPFMLDHVDILKGPSAVLYGQVSPGGLVNQVSRVPTGDAHGEVRLEIGSYGRVQGDLSSQGSLDGDRHWQYSLTAIGRTSGTRHDRVREERVGVTPALTYDSRAGTRVTLSGYYQRDPRGGYFNSLYPGSLAPGAYAGYLDSRLNVGDPGFDRFRREQYGVGLRFEQVLADGVSFRSNSRYSHVDIAMRSLQMLGFDGAHGLISRYSLQSDEDVAGFATDNQLQVDVSTGKLEHKLLFGLDYQRTVSDWRYLFGGATTLDVTAPVYDRPAGPLAAVIDNRQRLRQTGLYLQDQISIDRLRLTLGIRHDWAWQSDFNRLAGTGSARTAEQTSYRAGLLYLFDNGLAPYVSYSTSFEPTAGVDAGGNGFRPTTARQYEAGVKFQPSGVPILLTASAFDIRQDNVLTAGPVPGFSVQQGRIGSRGLEFETRGNVTRQFELIAAATLLDTKVKLSTNIAVIDKRPQAVPSFFASLWANYSIASGNLAGFNLGGGMRHVGKSYGDDLNTIPAPAYTVVDLALRYDLARALPSLVGTQLTFNVSNLLDREYYTSCSYSIYCQFGNRRQWLAGVRHSW